MRLLFSVIILSLILNSAFSQDAEAPQYGWKNEAVLNVNFSQNTLDNWTKGGENSWAWQTDLNAKFVNDQEKYNWANSGKIAYGTAQIGDDDPKKAVDEIKIESVLTYKMMMYVNPYVAATGLTQLTKGYTYSEAGKTAVSNLLDPGYFTQSFGFGYQKGSVFKSRIGASAKETITSDFPAPYADDPETAKIEKTKVEFGAESVTDLQVKLHENISLTSKLGLFSALSGFDEIDVDWDNLVTAKVTKYINVNFNFKLFYDKDLSSKRQIKQTLAIGLSYTLL